MTPSGPWATTWHRASGVTSSTDHSSTPTSRSTPPPNHPHDLTEEETKMSEFEGKTVLITGSGSLGGIGADTALLFAQQGAEVLVSGRDTERGQRVVETIVQAGGTARFLLADLANLDDVTRLAGEAGEVDV